MNRSPDHYAFHLLMEENEDTVMFAYAPSHYSFIFRSKAFFLFLGQVCNVQKGKAGQTGGLIFFLPISTGRIKAHFQVSVRTLWLISNARAGLGLKPSRPCDSRTECFVSNWLVVSEIEGKAFGYLLMCTNQSGCYGQMICSR